MPYDIVYSSINRTMARRAEGKRFIMIVDLTLISLQLLLRFTEQLSLQQADRFRRGHVFQPSNLCYESTRT